MKEKIKRLSIVCATGAEIYEVGCKHINSITEEVIQISDSERSTFYVCKDINKRNIALIKANAPVIIDYELS